MQLAFLKAWVCEHPGEINLLINFFFLQEENSRSLLPSKLCLARILIFCGKYIGVARYPRCHKADREKSDPKCGNQSTQRSKRGELIGSVDLVTRLLTALGCEKP